MKNFPNAFVIIIAAIFFAWVLTFIIPQGAYERVVDAETGRTTVVPNSYKSIDADNLSVFDLIVSVPEGISSRAETIVLILLIGGCFYVIERTGALNQGLNQLVKVLVGKENLALVIISILFITAGVAIGLQEEVIAMTPILLIFGRSLGYNPLTMVYVSYGSAVIGSSFSPSNPFGVIIAQKEMELELMSGLQFRLIILAIVTIVWIAYIIRYAKNNRIEKVAASIDVDGLTGRSKIILMLLLLTFIGVTFGLVKFDWGFNEMSACFFVLAIAAGMIAKMGLNRTTENYIAGFREMIFAAIIVGLSSSISLVLKEGMVIDTIVEGLFGTLEYLPPSLSAILMMASQSILHFPIPSYSGQAIMTMPILMPLADLIGLSRQVCVLAYQYGAIMMDMIIPTNGALMAVITLAGITYKEWLKFISKAMLLVMGIAALAILVAIQIGYN